MHYPMAALCSASRLKSCLADEVRHRDGGGTMIPISPTRAVVHWVGSSYRLTTYRFDRPVSLIAIRTVNKGWAKAPAAVWEGQTLHTDLRDLPCASFAVSGPGTLFLQDSTGSGVGLFVIQSVMGYSKWN